MTEPKLYGVKEAGKMLRVTPVTIRTWITQGRLPATKIGKSWIITEGTLKAIIKGGLLEIERAHTGRPKGGSLLPMPTVPAVHDSVFTMSPESEAAMKAEAKAKRDAKKKAPEAEFVEDDEEFNKWQSLSDASRALRQRAERAKKKGGEDATR